MALGDWWRTVTRKHSSATPPPKLTYRFDALSEDWELVAPEDRTRLLRELRRELPSGHALYGLRCQPLARRLSRDDTIWWLPHREQWALVHLTFQVETDPRWPITTVYTTWDELAGDLTD